MAWKGLHLTKPARLKLKDRQIVIEQDEGDVSFPLEDVAWIILDTQRTTLTGALLAACMDTGIAIITCNDKHTPSGLALPFHGHYRQAGVAAAQVQMTQPLKKRLWQNIIRCKIENQARLLTRQRCVDANELFGLAKLVRSGDPDNTEARAARFYWSRLFADYTRANEDDRRNKLLNYGYAIIRSAVARALVAHGLLPAFGVGHASIANAFNLADDLVEPFRPFVDQMAHELAGPVETRADPLTIDDRRAMATILTQNALMLEETVTLLVASEQAAASLARAMIDKDADKLILPRNAD